MLSLVVARRLANHLQATNGAGQVVSTITSGAEVSTKQRTSVEDTYGKHRLTHQSPSEPESLLLAAAYTQRYVILVSALAFE